MARTYEFYVIIAPVESPRTDGGKFAARAEVFEVVDGNQHRLDEPSRVEVLGATHEEAKARATALAQDWIAAERARHEQQGDA